MARKEKTYHFIYKTTNLLNGKYYIGMHSTFNLEDGYMGSGKRLKRSLNKYGKENHKVEILEFVDNRTVGGFINCGGDGLAQSNPARDRYYSLHLLLFFCV